MLSNIANPNADTMDLFVFLALVLFMAGGVVAVMQKATIMVLTCSGLAALAAGLLFLT